MRPGGAFVRSAAAPSLTCALWPVVHGCTDAEQLLATGIHLWMSSNQVLRLPCLGTGHAASCFLNSSNSRGRMLSR